MNKVTTFVGLGLAMLAAAAAWGADCVVDRAASAPAAPEGAATDDAVELKWDSGSGRWWLAWYTGKGSWVGNDFDISTISTYRAVEKIKLQSRSNWPNMGWDGFRLGIYDFTGSVPGSLLWGPKFVIPTGTAGWKEFSVGWTLPAEVNKFVAAQEQFYNYPNCEPYMVDNNPTFMGHSWQYYGGAWRLHVGYQNYRNVMLRVIVDNSTLGVAPSSLGRVKALYY
jgi:hypothetical protein